MQTNTTQRVTVPQAMDIAVGHHRAGRLREAENIYRQIVANNPEFAPAQHMMGVILFQMGRRQEGVQHVRRSIELNPNYSEALANLGHLLREMGQYDEALTSCRRAIELNPNLPEAYINLGSVCFVMQRFEEAIENHKKAIALRPEYADAYTNLGNALHALGRQEESVAAHRRAITFKPDFAEGYNNLAAGLHAMGRVDEAIEYYQKALQLKPNYPEALSNLGHALQSKRRFDEAIGYCRRSIEVQPVNPDAYNNLGNALQEKNDVEGAIKCFKKALEQRADHPDAINNLGNCYQEQGKLEEAVALYRRAIEIRPVFAKAYGNLGNALRGLGRVQESIEICQKAVEMQPNMEEAHINLGTALHLAGRYDEAIGECNKAIELRHDFPEAHKDLSLMLLVQGRFEEGWREYEWRMKLPNYFNSWDRFPKPLWDGSDFRDKTLLIHAEQGLGDSIHFCRFLPMVIRKGGKIILEVQGELVRLFKQTEILAGIEIVPRESKAGPKVPFDMHIPLMSLPWLLGKINPAVDHDVVQPPYIKPNPSLAEQWKTRFAPGDKLKIGIAWAGSKTNKNDRHRSITLKSFAPLLRVDADFYNLQFGPPAQQIADPPKGMNLIDFTPMIGDFADTAAMVPNLDLIVTVDTAIVHLAGAMSLPVWAFLQFTPDFRWLLQGDTSLWYPSVRLFRQTTFGDYNEVVERVAVELENFERARKSEARS
jgi:tetratricopeptide (TPR) repeat protein